MFTFARSNIPKCFPKWYSACTHTSHIAHEVSVQMEPIEQLALSNIKMLLKIYPQISRTTKRISRIFEKKFILLWMVSDRIFPNYSTSPNFTPIYLCVLCMKLLVFVFFIWIGDTIHTVDWSLNVLTCRHKPFTLDLLWWYSVCVWSI